MNIHNSIRSVLEYYKSGNLQQAASLCEELLTKNPDHITILHLLGVVYQQLQNYDAAIKYLKNAIELDHNSFEGFYNLGGAYTKKGELNKAVNCYQKVIELNPQFIDAYINLGNIFQSQRLFDEAISCYQKALQLNPNDARMYINLGIAFQNKWEIDKCIIYLEKSLQLNPNFAETYYHLGNIFKDKGQLKKAISYYQKAIDYNPNDVDSYNNLGIAFRDIGEIENSIACYKKVLELNPASAGTYNNLGISFYDRGQLDEAELYSRRALQIKPDFLTAYSNFLLYMNYNSQYNFQNIFSEHITFAQQFEKPLYASIIVHTNENSIHRKLKIGYVSPDFRQHSVAYFIEPVIALHNKNQFEIFCYSLVSAEDKVTRRIQEYADHWRNISSISDEQAAEFIRNDKIDILVDLAGHTANNRILLFARKPAPVQVSWIGYSATTGLSAIDYKLADTYTDPPGITEQFYTEKLIRMPGSFLCYLPDRKSPGVAPLPALTSGYITFGSFNKLAKVSPEVIGLWAKILKELFGAHLILKDKSFSDRSTCEYVSNMFKHKGIDVKTQLELLPWELSHEEHLNLYNRVDISLDTFPYNGTTTTCEALWMGVPVVTLTGNTYASRAGISLLSNIGIPELIARTPDEYIEIAINLTKDLDKLQSLRKNLRDMMSHSPLTDAQQFVLNLENSYRNVWEKWCRPG